MALHMPFNNKFRKMKPLLSHADVKDYIPETKWYSNEEAKLMIERYSTLFIKPNKGRIGIGVIRLRKLKNAKFQVHYQDRSVEYDTLEQSLEAVGKHFISGKHYLIQQGIDLATVLDRPFDFRIVMHKIDGQWAKTAWCAKISPPNLIVTNHARGGIIITLEQALKANKSLFDPKEVSKRLLEVSQKICDVFDSHFSFCIVGLDMAVDKTGHIWFIEANTSPDHAMFRKLGDPKLYSIIRRNEHKIRALSRKLREFAGNKAQ